jgi:hypothetical protein
MCSLQCTLRFGDCDCGTWLSIMKKQQQIRLNNNGSILLTLATWTVDGLVWHIQMTAPRVLAGGYVHRHILTVGIQCAPCIAAKMHTFHVLLFHKQGSIEAELSVPLHSWASWFASLIFEYGTCCGRYATANDTKTYAVCFDKSNKIIVKRCKSIICAKARARNS